MSRLIRSFIALDISDALKVSIEDIQNYIFPSSLGIRWVKPANLHLTLRFLGDIKSDRINQVIAIMDSLELPHKGLHLRFNSLGAFPKLDRPRAIWLGAESNPTLKKIFNTLDDGLEEIGLEDMTPAFKPHITIGRAQSDCDATAIKILIEKSSGQIDFIENIDKLTLYESHLEPGGSIYKILHQRHLT